MLVLGRPVVDDRVLGLLLLRRPFSERLQGVGISAGAPSAYFIFAVQEPSNAGAGHRKAANPKDAVPIPKFALLCGTLECELRNQRNTSNVNTL